ncbi:MAG TPA: polysaccharide biosynthesis protein [Roseibacterium sp.]|nr:polysaccharide biosynthesis protein [Roseibacterium sp.]
MIRTVLLILSGNAFGALMLFVRNLAVARLITVEDYGIAATFAISMAIVEMASGLGLQQLIIQDKEGNDPNLQAGLQGFNILRGVISGVILFFLAGPIAGFLNIPDVVWAYQLLALVPVIRGFEHFDIYRLNREMKFGPLLLTKTVPALIGVLSIWPLYLAYDDYRIMLYSVLLHWVLVVVTSHLVARRRYRANLDRSVMRRALHFGWPLLITNTLLFAIFQGDKIIVGRTMGLEDLALFTMGVTLTLSPLLVSASSEKQFFLPQLSAARDDDTFDRLANAAMQASLVSGLGLVTLMTLIARPLVDVLLGERYAALGPILVLFAIWQAVRIFKVGGTIAALSKAQTSNEMVTNVIRILALPIAWNIAVAGGTLSQILWVAIAGECLAFGAALVLVRVRLGLKLDRQVLPILIAFCLLGVAASTTIFPLPGDMMLLAKGLVVILFLATLASARTLRAYITN